MTRCSLWGDGVTKRFGRLTVLDGTSWRFTGRMTLLFAPNGSGKTTLLSLSLGIYKPTRGRAGACVPPGPGLGFFLESRELPLHARAGDFMAFAARLRGVRCNKECIVSVLETVGLPGSIAGRALGQLSSGQLRLVLVAQALVGEPEVIVLDEPFAGLDPYRRLRLSIALNRISRSSRLVISSHILGQLRPDEAYTLKEGKVRPIPPVEPRPVRLLDPGTGSVVEAQPEKALEMAGEGMIVLE